HTPRHDHLELPLRGIGEELVELRSLITTLGTADAVVLVDFGDLQPHAPRNLAEFTLLVGCGLVDGADTKVESRSASHGNPLTVIEGIVRQYVRKTNVIGTQNPEPKTRVLSTSHIVRWP